MSFKKILMAILILFTTIPLLAISIANYVVSSKSIIQSKKESLQALAYTNGLAIDELLQNQMREIEIMSSSITFIDYINYLANPEQYIPLTNYQKPLYETVKIILDNWIADCPHYLNAFLADKNGNIIISHDAKNEGHNIRNTSYYIGAIENSGVFVISDTYLEPIRDTETIVMSKHILDESGDTIGVLALFVSVDFFNTFVSNIKFEETGIAFLTDLWGKVLYHPYDWADLIIVDDNKEFHDFPENDKWVGLVQNYSYTSDRGEHLYISSYNLKHINWVLHIGQSYAEINNSTNKIYVLSVVGFIVTLIGSIIVGYITTKKITKPIKKLQRVFASAAAENEYISCEIESKNEFGELAQNYNIMIERLNQNHENLLNAYQKIESTQKELQENYNLLVNQKSENEYLAYTDLLTGLFNRLGFEQKLKEILSTNATGGLVYIDLDNFKSISEILGHKLCDTMLKNIAKKLITPQFVDIVAASRIGTDEFIIIIIGSQRDLEIYCKEIISLLEPPLEVEGKYIHVSASMGITVFPKDGTDLINLLNYVETAMYKAKSIGKNTYCFFDDEMRNKICRYNQVLQVLRTCIENNEIFMVYQPEVDFKTGEILYFEAFMRLKTPSLGFINPTEFIPIAEENGLMVNLSYWSMRKACEFIKTLIDQGMYSGKVAINISSAQLMEKDFSFKIIELLEKVEMPFNNIQLEITEKMLLHDLPRNKLKLIELKKHGVTIALDDFGTSYTSLNHFINIPLDVIKIDKSFVNEVCGNYKKQIILKSIIDMSHKLNLKVVSEGVESIEQKLFLKEQNCDIMQGYLYSAPISADMVFEMLKE